MAKAKSNDKITSSVKKAGGGAQSIVMGSDDFGAREYWAEAQSPPSVKKMVGSSSEFSKKKHDGS